MNISFEYYKIFYYAAKYKNLTQAAEALHNNQPNVSRIIKLLEHELGCSLLIRTNRGITLTPEGEELYSHIRIAVNQIQAAEEKLLSRTKLQDGMITIGASETALYMALLPALNAYKKAHPRIHIRIQNHLTKEAVDSVKNGLVDFSVVATPAEVSGPLKSTMIMKFRDILIGGPSYHFTDTPVALNEVRELPFVCLAQDTMTYQFYFEFYRKHNLTFKPEFEATTTDQILPIIQNDLGIGFVPSIFAVDALKKKEVFQIPLIEEIPERQICLVENENHPLSVAAAEMKKILTQDVTHPAHDS